MGALIRIFGKRFFTIVSPAIIVFIFISFSLLTRKVAGQDKANGQVTFSDVTKQAGVLVEIGFSPSGLNWVDINGDSLYDLYFANSGIAFKNKGNGTFTKDTILPQSFSACWADLNNDGKQDVILLPGWESNKNTIKVHYQTAKKFVLADTKQFLPLGNEDFLYSAAVADYDADGLLDFYCTNYDAREFGGEPDRLYKNKGNFKFTDVSGIAIPKDRSCGRGVTCGDYDNDGDVDIYVSNYRLQPNFLYRNNGDGTFTDVAASAGVAGKAHTVGADWGDYNKDGFLDIIAPGIHGYPHLYKNNGDGTFTEVTSEAGLKILGEWAGGSWTDYDNDGDLDLLLSKWYRGHFNHLFRNNGDGTFTDVTKQVGISLNDCPSVCWGDYNDDGWLDIFATTYTGTGDTYRTVLYKNNGGLPNHWIQIELKGEGSNCDAIGARITVVTGGKKQIREVMAGTGKTIQNMRRVHFGLGNFTKIDTIEIRWPNRATTTLTNVDVDQILYITPKGIKKKRAPKKR